MLVRTPRACLGWGPVSRSGSGMAIAWLMRKARVKEEHRRGKAWEEASGQQHFLLTVIAYMVEHREHEDGMRYSIKRHPLVT